MSAKSRGQIAYEAWNLDMAIKVPWESLDPKDHEAHHKWASDYERMVSDETAKQTQLLLLHPERTDN